MKRRQLLENMAILMGGALSASLVRAVTSGAGAWSSIEHVRFDDTQRAMCRVLAELIIPETDTPGAIAAGVPHFVELMVSDWYTATERKIFVAGLESLDRDCLTQFGQSFLQCGTDEQVAALTLKEAEASNYKGSASNTPFSKDVDEQVPFFTKLKELTVLGYYSSEVGATQELSYLPMPMEYSDIDFADVGRQWSN